MASAPPVVNSTNLIKQFVSDATPEKAKKHMPKYVQELADEVNEQCAKVFEAIRQQVQKVEQSHFASIREIELTDCMLLKFSKLKEVYIHRFQEKYNLPIQLKSYNTKDNGKEAKLSEFEDLVKFELFPEGNKSKFCLYTTKFIWNERDLPKIFPETQLFYSTYQADPTPLEELLWNAREETGSHTFKMGERAIKVHRDLLTVRSEYFRTKFASGMKVEDEQDVSAETMEQAVHFLYKKQLPDDLTLKQLLDLHRAANKWIDAKLQQCVTKALGKWRDNNPLSKETLPTYCELALNTKVEFGPHFKTISKTIKEHVLKFVENQKAWDIFDPLVTLDTYTKWLKVAEANAELCPRVLQQLHQKGAQLIKQAAKEQKEAEKKRIPEEKNI